jgi:hypothetical protein
VRIIAVCHHYPENIYPAFGVFDSQDIDIDDIESFGQQADEWVRRQPFGWLLEASERTTAIPWSTLRAGGSTEPT